MTKNGFRKGKIIAILMAVLIMTGLGANTGLAATVQISNLPNPLQWFVGNQPAYDLSRHFSDTSGNPLTYLNIAFDDDQTKTTWMNSVKLSSSGILSGNVPTAAEIGYYYASFEIKDSAGKSIFAPLLISVYGQQKIAVTPDMFLNQTPVFIGQSFKKSFVVSNSGNMNLVVGAISISEADASEFRKENDTASGKTLSQGQTAGFDIVFSPVSAGSKIIHILIPSDDPNTPSMSVTVGMTATTRQNILVSPSAVTDHTPVVIGSSLRKSFVVSNSGGQNLVVGTISISGANASEFRKENDTASGKNMAPGQNESFDIVFSPVSAGIKAGYVVIPSDDPDTPSTTIPLEMLGAVKETAPSAPVLSVKTEGKKLTLSWTPQSNAFGYTLYYAYSSDPNTYLSLGMGTQTSFSVELWNGASFYVKVKAFNNLGESDYSNTELFRILTVPDAPVLTITSKGISVSLSWTSVPGAEGYMLYYAPYPNATAESIRSYDMNNQTSLAFDFPNLAFYVAIQAYNSKGSSGYSNIGYFVTGAK